MKKNQFVFVAVLSLAALVPIIAWFCAGTTDDSHAEMNSAIYLINAEKYAEAARQLQQEAVRNPQSAWWLGLLYATGRIPSPEPMIALRYFEMSDALRKERGAATYNAGWEFMHGAIGLPPDYRQAYFWFRESARAGHPQGVKLAELVQYYEALCSKRLNSH